MNILQRICRVLAVAGILTLSAWATPSADRVNEVCVVAGDIGYCAPKNA